MSDPFDFDHFVALPRLSGLRLSPDGSRLVVAVATPAPDGKKLRTALWSVDPEGKGTPRRLTRSAAGESSAAFLPDGSIVFTSARPDPDAKPDGDDPPAGLWHLAAEGGEARLLVAPPGGVGGLAVAEASGALALMVSMHPGVEDFEQDGEREKARKEAGVQALLFEDYPIRFWDHYLGPRDPRIFIADAPAGDAALGPFADVTGSSGTALPEASFDIAPDGSAVVTTWRRDTVGDTGDDIVLIDRATKARRALTEHGWYGDPVFSRDGASIAAIRGSQAGRDDPMRT
ncbi:MAG TPA: hypothetical protein VD763_03775, partial [Candidatus Saccharimonadales bacterium]|nr:hypothetical protein [Candidatus Saccharimonadales bacterium]